MLESKERKGGNMEKYVKPCMQSEKFIANEYIAACYMIYCQTPNNNFTYKYLYDDSNHNGEWDKGDKLLYSSDGWFGGFSGCKKWHKGVISDEPPVANGFVTRGNNPDWNKAESVYWWEERLGSTSDYHVMVPGDESYVTNPNAS